MPSLYLPRPFSCSSTPPDHEHSGAVPAGALTSIAKVGVEASCTLLAGRRRRRDRRDRDGSAGQMAQGSRAAPELYFSPPRRDPLHFPTAPTGAGLASGRHGNASCWAPGTQQNPESLSLSGCRRRAAILSVLFLRWRGKHALRPPLAHREPKAALAEGRPLPRLVVESRPACETHLQFS